MTSPLWAVLPGGIDDPATPSGGNRYDRIVLNLLAGTTGRAGRAGTTGQQAGAIGATGEQAGAIGTAWARGGVAPIPPRDVHEIAITGSWPRPAAPARAALSRALSDIPDKSDVLIDGLVACGVPEILEPHRRRLRLIVLVHLPLSDESGLSPEAAARLRDLEGTTLRLATKVIATSRIAATDISDMHGLSGVEVAVPGVEAADENEPSVAGNRLLCVASVSLRKGQDLLVRALEDHLADLDWTCTFAGALIRPVPFTSGNIRFAGPLAGSALDDAYAKADLFVLPSRAETYGMVVTEALARGLPVLATDVGGVPEALGRAPDGTLPGLLIPPEDPVALAAALRAWLTDPALRDRLRASARGRRTTLPTWADTARRLSEVLDA